MMDLRAWVRSRWVAASAGATGLFPAWEELGRGGLHLAPEPVSRLQAMIGSTGVALVTGPRACGKSVFGACFARRWADETAGRAFWLDLREQQRMMATRDLSSLDRFILQAARAKLLVVDSAHLGGGFMRLLLDRLASRDPQGQSKCLLLARQPPGVSHSAGGIHERLARSTVRLAVSGVELHSVARRHLGGAADPWTARDYNRWAAEHHGDLVSFGLAVCRPRDGEPATGTPDRATAEEQVRRRYLQRARRCKGKIEPFLRLCAMASLELPTDQRVLGQPFPVLYRALSGDGLVLPLEQDRGAPSWLLCHARLATLILEAAAREAGISKDQLRLQQLLEAVRRCPASLPAVTERLSWACTDRSVLERWRALLQEAGSLVQQACIEEPFRTPFVVRRFRLPLDLDQLVQQGPLRQSLVASLARRLPQFVMPMLELLGPLRAAALLDDMLEGYQEVLGRCGPGDSATFLKFVGARRAEPLVTALLEQPGTLELLAGSSPGDCAAFLQYIGRRRAEPLVQQLLERGYLELLRQAPPDQVVRFLRQIGPDRAEPLVQQLLSGDYLELLRRTPPNLIVPWLEYVGPERAEPLVQQLLSGGYLEILRLTTTPNLIIPLLRYLGKRRAATLLDSLLAGDSYLPVLRHTAPGDLAALLQFAGERRAQPLLDALFSEEGYLEVLRRSPPHMVGQLVSCLEPVHARPLLGALLRQGYLQVLRRSPPGQTATLLRHVGPGRAEMILDSLLSGEGYLEALRRAPPGETTALLRAMDGSRAAPLVNALLERQQYLPALRRSNAGDVATFLDYLGQDHRTESLLKALHEDGCHEVLLRTPPHMCGRLLDLLGVERAVPMLQTLLSGEGYLEMLQQAKADNVCAFYQYVLDLCGADDEKSPLLVLLRQSVEGWCQVLLDSDAGPHHDFGKLAPLIRLCGEVSEEPPRRIMAWLEQQGDQLAAWAGEAPEEARAGLAMAISDGEELHLRGDLWNLLWTEKAAKADSQKPGTRNQEPGNLKAK